MTEFGGVGTNWFVNKLEEGEDNAEDGDRWSVEIGEGEKSDIDSSRSSDNLGRFVATGEETSCCVYFRSSTGVVCEKIRANSGFT